MVSWTVPAGTPADVVYDLYEVIIPEWREYCFLKKRAPPEYLVKFLLVRLAPRRNFPKCHFFENYYSLSFKTGSPFKQIDCAEHTWEYILRTISHSR